MAYIPLESVESSMISKIGYDPKTQTLRVMFQNGDAYDYPTFTDRDWRAFQEAESLGKHFHRVIKPVFGYAPVTEAQMREPCCDHPERDTCDESCLPCDEWCCPCAREASAVMTREKALAMFVQSVAYLRDDDMRVADCNCGGCVLCAYNFLERATEPTTEQGPDASCPHGADGRDCEEGCVCRCHQVAVDPLLLVGADDSIWRESVDKKEDNDGTED